MAIQESTMGEDESVVVGSAGVVTSCCSVGLRTTGVVLWDFCAEEEEMVVWWCWL